MLESVQKKASDALFQIGAPAVEPLIAALKDANPDVRGNAAYALGLIKDPRAVEPRIGAPPVRALIAARMTRIQPFDRLRLKHWVESKTRAVEPDRRREGFRH